MKIRINKEDVIQITITSAITFIVGMMGCIMFDLQCGVYSALTSGLSVGVGKEYADSLDIHNQWNWNDVITVCSGALLGLIIFLIFYLIR